ncbi:hypothetical protein [Flavobacterium sp. N3904]|uniref:hypothetical protein n=1 Tax=Flavobacterium sp. N3904 TaxID=2986835 RepID=UPI002224C2FB|nr:hypothetical protein [Flavobacterium sp. N3904]
MKKLFILISFLSISSYAQNSFFIDKKGKKTIMSDQTVEIIVIDERISYAEVDKTWEKYIKFKDLDYAIIGPHLFRSYKLLNMRGKPERERAFFVMVETKERTLLCYTYTVIGKYSSIDHYNIKVIDSKNNILDYVNCNSTKSDKEERMKIMPMLEKYFSDCPGIMNQFSKDETDEYFFNVLEPFTSPKYTNCN